jgi:hypothetical protein
MIRHNLSTTCRQHQQHGSEDGQNIQLDTTICADDLVQMLAVYRQVILD